LWLSASDDIKTSRIAKYGKETIKLKMKDVKTKGMRCLGLPWTFNWN